MKILKRTLLLSALLAGFTALLTTINPNYATATPNILGAWRTAYPDSTSADASCQLCHQNSSGGNGWNAYGWSIREGIRSDGLAVADAILAVEMMDADGNGTSNIDEIVANTQPGWTDGAVNVITFSDGSTEVDQSPPAGAGMVDATSTMSATQGISNPIPAEIPTGMTIMTTQIADEMLSPVLGTYTDVHPDYLFVVDQAGFIYILNLMTGDQTMFLDVSAQLSPLGIGVEGFENFDERGLLGLTFHPDYETNGLIYTYQSEPVDGTADFSSQPDGVTAHHQSVVAEWTVPNPTDPMSTPDMTSKRVIMRLDQPQFNHNGGDMVFGPDGMLYIAVGDGGGADDTDGQPFIGGVVVDGHGVDGNGQNAANPYGTILRIDVSGTNADNGLYGIPADNPFVGDDTMLDETYAYGFRNTYRISFDMETGDLYAGDVGQNDIEEVDLVTAGGNYGWKLLEGTFFFDDNGTGDGFITTTMPADLPTDLIPPIAQYDHDEGLSVIGGFVYRGADSDLAGRYIFGDWSSDFVEPQGRLFYLAADKSINEFVIDGQDSVGLFIHGFGQDANGDVYVMGNLTGTPSTDADGNRTGVVLRITPMLPTSVKVVETVAVATYAVLGWVFVALTAATAFSYRRS